MGTEPLELHECCVVPVRITSSGAEFCLMTPVSENRWEYPKVPLEPSQAPSESVLLQAAENAGLRGDVLCEEPLGSYVASRRNETRSMVGYLMRVEEADDLWPKQQTHRRLWCLAEEARVRIRRKPLRRFIDLALQNLAAQQRATSNG